MMQYDITCRGGGAVITDAVAYLLHHVNPLRVPLVKRDGLDHLASYLFITIITTIIIIITIIITTIITIHIIIIIIIIIILIIIYE